MKQLEGFLKTFYIPNHNYVATGDYEGVNIYALIYGLITAGVFALMTLHLFLKIFDKKFLGFESMSPLKNVVRFLFVLIFFIAVFQTMAQFISAKEKWSRYGSTPVGERYPSSLKGIYSYAEYCKASIPGSQQARLLTDININKDPGMYVHRFFSYLLYPIDVRGLRPDEKDYLIMLEKKDARLHVPDGYVVLRERNAYNLVAKKQK